MPFNTEGYFDIDESLRVSELANTQTADIAMKVVRKGVQVEGESIRKYHNGSSLIDVLGYFFAGYTPGNARRVYRSVTIVKHADVASSSLLSLLDTHADLKVTLSSYKAGGEAKSTDAQPSLEIVLDEAKLKAISIFTTAHSHLPMEILSFDFRQMTMSTRAQTRSGEQGPARSCVIDNRGDRT